MRYLITGANGMLGRDLQAALDGRDVIAAGWLDLDITDADAVAAATADIDVVINAAAYTKVDEAEEHEDDAFRANAIGAEILAAATSANGARLVHISTDYVFDGSATEPYPEDAPRNPISAYGRTKAEGELRSLAANPDGTLIVRTAWLYGQHGPNFARTMLRLAETKETWTVVDDQWGQPTWTADLAAKIVELLDADAPAGIYHGTSTGRTNWFGFARAVLAAEGLDPDRITPTDSSTFVRPAPRPAFSVLGHDRFAAVGLEPIRDWRDGLADAVRCGALI
jgi:dTDP-4-dehydrorhamnose reductase